MEIEKTQVNIKKGKNKLSKEELLSFVEKLLGNLVEDTLENIETIDHTTKEMHTFNEMDEMAEKPPEISDKRVKTMLKVLHNVPLVSYNDLDYGDGRIYPLIQMQILQQQVYNLCGYHMSHTLMQFVNYLKSIGSTVYLENINSSTR